MELSGYTSVEKLAIAKDHLLPKQLGEHGLAKGQLEIDDEAGSQEIPAPGERRAHRNKYAEKSLAPRLDDDSHDDDIDESGGTDLTGEEE
ncbi:hypothetical protein HY251_20275 [bacterium]|nr:hypothetical protein [bacterium]